MKHLRSNLPLSLLLTAQYRILVGGQAVIEGVLMRVPGAYAVAVDSLKLAFGAELSRLEGRRYLVDAIG